MLHHLEIHTKNLQHTLEDIFGELENIRADLHSGERATSLSNISLRIDYLQSRITVLGDELLPKRGK